MSAAVNGLDRCEATGLRFYQAELHRLHGEVLAELGATRVDEARASLYKAIEVAQAQVAVELHRRAALSMQRLEAKIAFLDEEAIDDGRAVTRPTNSPSPSPT